MTDIRTWLESLDLGEYADAFEANDIDRDLLPDLTAADLRNLGVVSAGHRVRLRGAIEALEGDGAGAEEGEGAPPVPEAAGDAERRQITVLFCDLVGSTALAEQIDAEELRALIQAYQKACAAAVTRYDGHVAQYLGDGLMSYFGWPQAHEDDAERAVRAGLDIVAAVQRIAGAPCDLQVRVGIASGPVVVGDPGTADTFLPKLAVGETPNMAARMQELAGPNEVVIGQSTHRLIGHAFVSEALSARPLEGAVAPTQAWRITGVAEAEGRFEAIRGKSVIPIVGRDAELTLLLQHWEQVKDGEGQVVLLSGEPGIGKSRLVQELRAHVAADRHMALHHQCSPFYTGSALYPIVTRVERAAGFHRDDPDSVKLEKLDKLLAAQPRDVSAHAPLLAAFLSIDSGDRYPPLNLSARRQKERTIEALVDLIVGLAGTLPLLMIFEDLHWVDPTTLEAMSEVIARAESLPIYMVATYRPEFEPPWPAVGHIAVHSLTRLSRRARAAMVAEITGGKSLPDEVLDQIVDKTDGVPLFVEELTKTVLEAGILKEADGRYRLDGPLPPLAIPPTLQDSLMARLDRLGPVKEIAQIGACVGREFSPDLLSAVAPVGEEALQSALRDLVDSELIIRRGSAPDTVYAFKHALVHDAAYGSLLKTKRQELHGAIARAVETAFPRLGRGKPEFLARHYGEAGRPERALPLWLSAGQTALAKANVEEAIRHFDAGLRLIEHLPADRDRSAFAVRFHTSIGYARIQQRGYATPEARIAFETAEALLRDTDMTAEVFPVMVGIGLYRWVRGDMPGAVQTFKRMCQLAADSDNPEFEMLGRAHLGCAYVNTGKLTKASELLSTAQDSFLRQSPERQAEQRATYGQDIGCVLSTWQASGYACMGYLDRAIAHAEAGVERARTLDHPFSLIMALGAAGQAASLARDTRRALAWADEAIAIHRDQGLPFWGAWGLVDRGVCLRLTGHLAEAVATLEDAYEMVKSVGGTGGLSYLFAETALAYSDFGQHAVANGWLRRAEKELDDSQENIWRAPVACAAGELALAGDASDPTAAANHFERAIAIARGQDAHMFELRAACDLARIWGEQNERQKALDLLAPIHAWFTEGLDGPDLTKASRLLHELA